MPFADDVQKLLALAGVPAAGTLKKNVDALCEMTGVPFSSIKETAATLDLVLAWASEVVPKVLAEAGLDTTGSMGKDVAALREAVGVDPSKFCLELRELCVSVGVESKQLQPGSPLANHSLWYVPPKPKAPPVVEAPCVCDKGVDQCKECKAIDHPCVCARVLCRAVDMPVSLCKAKVHACLCSTQFLEVTFSHNPRIAAVRPSGHNCYKGRLDGAPWLCRQHDGTAEPPKKKVKTEQ